MITHGELVALGFEKSNQPNIQQYEYEYIKLKTNYAIYVNLFPNGGNSVLLTSDEMVQLGEDSYEEIELYGIKTIEDLKTLIRLCKGD